MRKKRTEKCEPLCEIVRNKSRRDLFRTIKMSAGTPMDMDMSYGGSFASANFTDDNAAGSGPTTSRAISNLSIVHMNDVSWKSSIPLLFDQYETDWISKMVKPVEGLDRTKQLNEILKKLSHPMFNPSASWISTDITNPVTKERIDTTITSTIGVSSSTFQSTIQSLYKMYQSTVHTMFEMDDVLQRKLKNVNDLHTQLSILPTFSHELSSTSSLQTSISEYTAQMLESSNIHEEYPKFIHTVGLFQHLRSMLKASSAFQEKELRNPCTICMNEEVDSVIVPCGHPFCSGCAKKTKTICFLCRTPVLQKQRVYF